MSKNITIEISNKNAIVTICRPEVYNALNKETKFELIKAFKTLSSDSSISSIILTSQGKAFCSGQDLMIEAMGALTLEKLLRQNGTLSLRVFVIAQKLLFAPLMAFVPEPVFQLPLLVI